MEDSRILNPGISIKASVTLEDVKKIIFESYGIKAKQLHELNGYDDWNYHVTTEKSDSSIESRGEVGENGYVLKIINSLDSKKPRVFEAQSLLLLHLENYGFRCPKPILTKAEQFFETVELRSGEHIVRLLEYIDGTIFHKVPRTPRLLYQAGEIVSRMDIAMKSFHHPAYNNYKTLWMLDSVPQITQFLFAIQDKTKKQLVQNVVQEFQDRVLSISNTLERGLIHGDFNEQNIIVEEQNGQYEIKAVIDFGDAHIACYLYELAITMCYMMLIDKDVYAGGHVLAGYSAIRKVPDAELSLLRICIAARLCQSLVIGAYSNLQDPENSYVLTTAAQGWILLDQIWNETDSGLLHKWTNI
ncbi:hydroxylysine kinase isoform X2 [Leptinotarsa decemlineata]|uniref:hydroxylysine kinase isoform X2 n=1 Tax=Leptinotarsa decemlineata TaxID=7539 RepID=UPI003D30925B